MTAISPSDLETRFTGYLREIAPLVLGGPASGSAEVNLLRAERREKSGLYRFELRAEGRRRQVMVKVSGTPGRGAIHPRAGRPRPRLWSAAGAEVRAILEHQALAGIHAHVAALGDPRFGAVEVFGGLPEHAAVVMEFVEEPSLRQVVAGGRRRHPTHARTLPAVFENTGAWLRIYHGLAEPHPTERRYTTRSEFTAYLAEVATFLGDALGEAPFFAAVAERSTEAALGALPDPMPTGLSHGDFAMRNVLVSPEGSVRVLDTLARYTAAIYDDLGYFLMDVRAASALGVRWRTGMNRARLEELEKAFLHGYFGTSEIPHRAIALYEVLALLDRWASLLVSAAASRSWRKRGLYLARKGVMSPFYRKLLHERLSAATAEGEPWIRGRTASPPKAS
jgi:aminoglycoside phosphotransferase (APT) family kinase protein